MLAFYKRVAALLEENCRPFAVCTVVETKGSTPRHSGKMIVFQDAATEFTVGGGPAEKAAIDAAVSAIACGKPELIELILNKAVGGGLNAECGGQMKIHIEVFANRPQLILIGAGHVNRQIFKLAEGLGFETLVIDDRESTKEDSDFAKAGRLVVSEEIALAVAEALPYFKEKACAVIATKDADEAALRPLRDCELAYLGVIGSRRKVSKIRAHLLSEGCSQAWLDRIYMPIGLDLGAETPEEIAISVWAQLLKVLKGASGVDMRSRQGAESSSEADTGGVL